MKKLKFLVKETWQSFTGYNLQQIGAALAYYTMFSLFPALMLLLAFLGTLLHFWPWAIDIEKQVLEVMAQNYSEQVSSLVQQGIASLKAKTGYATGIGLLTLLFTGSAAFEQLNSGFRQIWERKITSSSHWLWNFLKQSLQTKLLALLVVAGIGFLLFISILLTTLNQQLAPRLTSIPFIGSNAGYMLGLLTALALNTGIFAFIFKYFPRRKILWREVGFSALLTALLWEGMKRTLTFYLATTNYANVYSAIQAVLVLMLWIYISTQILYLGASFSRAWILWRRATQGAH